MVIWFSQLVMLMKYICKCYNNRSKNVTVFLRDGCYESVSFLFASFVFLSPVPGPFPLLLHLPNGQTMPVAIPASITSSNVHVPAAVPVSYKFRLFKFL